MIPDRKRTLENRWRGPIRSLECLAWFCGLALCCMSAPIHAGAPNRRSYEQLPADLSVDDFSGWKVRPATAVNILGQESDAVAEFASDGTLSLPLSWNGEDDADRLSFRFEYSGSNIPPENRLDISFRSESGEALRPVSVSGAELNYPFWYPVTVPFEGEVEDKHLIVDIAYRTHGHSSGRLRLRHVQMIEQRSNDPAFKDYSWEDYPREYVPPLTEDLIEYVASRPPATARIAPGPDGLPRLTVNGREAVLSTLRGRSAFPRDSLPNATFREIGADIVFLDYNVGSYNPERGWIGPWNLNSLPFRPGPDAFNTNSLQASLWRILRVNPDANIVIYLHLDDYPDWPEDHPDQVVRNEQGQAVLSRSHVVGVEPVDDDCPRIRKTWSFFSEVFKEYCSDSLRAVIRHVEQSVPGRAVAGYYLGGGVDNQLYLWEFPKRDRDAALWIDYSPPARAAFREWLEQKYATIEALNRSWDASYGTFREIQPPPSVRMVGDDHFFYELPEERACVDFSAFMSEGRARFVDHLAGVCKEEASRDIIVGVSAGAHLGARSDNNANRILLQSPWIDFLLSQATYSQRFPPNVGGFNAILGSYPVNGKIFLADNDHPTYLSPGKHHGMAGYREGMTMEDVRSMWRRELGRLWSRNGSSHYHFLGHPWVYEDCPLKEELRTLIEMERGMKGFWRENSTNELAVIYQEEAKNYCNRFDLSFLWTRVMWKELNASGVVYRDYELHDLLRGRTPPHKVYLFVNLLKIDEAVREKLEELQRQGATLVFMQGVGYDATEVDRRVATGLDLSPVTFEEGGGGPVEEHELLRHVEHRGEPIPARFQQWDRVRQLDPGYLLHPIGSAAMRVVPDENTVVLARYAGYDDVAVAVRDHGEWTSCFIGAYGLNRRLINNLARWSGLWVAAPPGHVVAANEKMFMIHPLESGEVTLDLARQVALKEVEPGRTYSVPAKRLHTLTLEAGHSYLFSVQHSHDDQ
jgi:hypothetical protein